MFRSIFSYTGKTKREYLARHLANSKTCLERRIYKVYGLGLRVGDWKLGVRF